MGVIDLIPEEEQIVPARSARRILPQKDEWNLAIALGGVIIAAVGIVAGLATSNTAITGISLSVCVGGAIGWLAAGELPRRKY